MTDFELLEDFLAFLYATEGDRKKRGGAFCDRCRGRPGERRGALPGVRRGGGRRGLQVSGVQKRDL